MKGYEEDLLLMLFKRSLENERFESKRAFILATQRCSVEEASLKAAKETWPRAWEGVSLQVMEGKTE